MCEWDTNNHGVHADAHISGQRSGRPAGGRLVAAHHRGHDPARRQRHPQGHRRPSHWLGHGQPGAEVG